MKLLLIFQWTKCELKKKKVHGAGLSFLFIFKHWKRLWILFFLSYIQFISLKQIKARPIWKEVKLKQKRERKKCLNILVSGVSELRETNMGINQNLFISQKLPKLYLSIKEVDFVLMIKSIIWSFQPYLLQWLWLPIVSNKLIVTLLQCSRLIKAHRYIYIYAHVTA